MPVPHRGVAQATPRRAQSEEQRQKPPLRAFRSPAGCSVHRRGRKWPVSRLAGRGIRPIPRGALPRAYATGYAGFGVHVRVPVPHLCSSEQRAAGGRWLTCRRWAAPRRCLGQASRADQPAGARRALGGHSAGNSAAAHHERGDGHQPPPRFISVEAGRCELEAQISGDPEMPLRGWLTHIFDSLPGPPGLRCATALRGRYKKRPWQHTLGAITY